MNPEIVASFPRDIAMVLGSLLALVAVGFLGSLAHRLLTSRLVGERRAHV